MDDDFEERLRSELTTAAEPLGPTPGLRADIDRRVRHHRRVRRAQVVIGVAGVLLVIIGVGLFLESDDRGNEPQTFADESGAGAGLQADRCDLVDGFGLDDRNRFTTGTGPVTRVEDRYVGLDEQVALAQAGEDGLEVRVVCRDGVPSTGALDHAPGRLDLYVVGGEVITVHVEDPADEPLD